MGKVRIENITPEIEEIIHNLHTDGKSIIQIKRHLEREHDTILSFRAIFEEIGIDYQWRCIFAETGNCKFYDENYKRKQEYLSKEELEKSMSRPIHYGSDRMICTVPKPKFTDCHMYNILNDEYRIGNKEEQIRTLEMLDPAEAKKAGKALETAVKEGKIFKKKEKDPYIF